MNSGKLSLETQAGGIGEISQTTMRRISRTSITTLCLAKSLSFVAQKVNSRNAATVLVVAAIRQRKL